jgi:hypothetical protein
MKILLLKLFDLGYHPSYEFQGYLLRFGYRSSSSGFDMKKYIETMHSAGGTPREIADLKMQSRGFPDDQELLAGENENWVLT